MKKAAVVVLLLAGVAAVAGEAGIMDGFGNFVADVQAEDELPDNEKAQNESEEVTGEEEDSASKIDTSITIGTGSRIAVVSKATDGEYWKLVHRGMEDAVKDINTAYDFSSDDAVTMTFEGPSDEQDVETQINTLDAVIAENPTVLCMSASDIESCQAQLEAASENGIPVVVFDSNVNEDELAGEDNDYVKAVREYAADVDAKVFVVCAQIEQEISELDDDEKKEFLEDLGLEESGLEKLISASYSLLGLISFLTSGEDETRAWTIKEGTKAPQAAGKIHTDFERGFICAEVVSFEDLKEYGTMQACKEKGLVRQEGKEYVVKDGDIIVFRFNV